MALRNLSHLISLISLRVEIVHTLVEVQAHPLTQSYVAPFEQARNEWDIVHAEELSIRDAIAAVNARIFSLDNTFNWLAGSASKAIMAVTDDDKTHPLYIAYFNKKSLSDFKRPILGSQYTAMKGWVTELQKSDVPALAALAPEVEAAVAAAAIAIKAREDLETQNRFFREVGNRKKLFDRVNAIRKTTYGELARMPHEVPGLPSNFADLFFRHESGSGAEAEEASEPTIESLDEEIKALEQQIEQKQEQRAALEAEAKKREEAEKQAAIAELEKAAAEAAQKLAEAQAKIAALSK
jgi:hypothetical protein